MKYIGSKQKLLDYIDFVIEDNKIKGETFCDLFSGTAVVGQHFKEKGYKVISNDFMYFSYVLQYVKIKMNSYPEFKGLTLKSVNAKERCIEVIDYLNSVSGMKGFIYDNYTLESREERTYYTRENAEIIDTMLIYIRSYFEGGAITEDEMFFLLSAVIYSMPDYANTTGTFTAYLKTFTPKAKKKFTIKLPEIVTSNKEHECYNREVNELIQEIKCDILYIDPPYSNVSYSSYYHLLETAAKGDTPTITGKTGVRDDSVLSGFSSIKKAYSSFKNLITNADTKYIILSYSNEGILSKDEMIGLLRTKGEVKVYERAYKRYRSDDINARDYKMGDNDIIEYLFFVENQETPEMRELRKTYLLHPRN